MFWLARKWWRENYENVENDGNDFVSIPGQFFHEVAELLQTQQEDQQQNALLDNTSGGLRLNYDGMTGIFGENIYK